MDRHRKAYSPQGGFQAAQAAWAASQPNTRQRRSSSKTKLQRERERQRPFRLHQGSTSRETGRCVFRWRDSFPRLWLPVIDEVYWGGCILIGRDVNQELLAVGGNRVLLLENTRRRTKSNGSWKQYHWSA